MILVRRISRNKVFKDFAARGKTSVDFSIVSLDLIEEGRGQRAEGRRKRRNKEEGKKFGALCPALSNLGPSPH
jgi:hypothetical protein